MTLVSEIPLAIAPKRRRQKQRPAGASPAEAASSIQSEKSEKITETVENKLTIMSNRIRDLEDALQLEFSTRRALEQMLCTRVTAASGHEKESTLNILASSESNLSNDDTFAAQGIGSAATKEKLASEDTHPLLAADLLDIKKGIDQYASSSKAPEENTDVQKEEPDATSELMGTFGMLSIRDGQYVRLLGASPAKVRSSATTVNSHRFFLMSSIALLSSGRSPLLKVTTSC